MEITGGSKSEGLSRKNPMYNCNYDSSCSFRTVYRQHVDRHISKVHLKISLPKKFHCPHAGCDYRSSNNSHVKQHFNNRHNESRQKLKFPCPICTKILNSKFTLERHISTHTAEYLIYCDLCEFKTSYNCALQTHSEVQHLGLKTVARPKKFKCDKCDLSFPSKAHLANHMLVHSKEKPFICSFPGCGFRSNYCHSLKEHRRRHSSKRNFPCPMCHKQFQTNYEMDRHVVRIHTTEKSVKCDLCPYATSSIANLRNHLVTKHKTKCENHINNNSSGNPEKAAASEDDINSIRNNDAQRRYKGYYCCEQPGCAFRTKHKHYIAKHRGRVHAKQRLHSCSICAKKFFTELSLVGHIRTHTGERPFKCPFCNYAATLHPNIMRHVKVRHRDSIKNCKSLPKLVQSGKEPSADKLLSSLNPVVLLERTLFHFV